jgi:Fe-S cluster biosynthesis and repair protein YggX
MKPKNPEELLNLTKFLFEANEDLNLILVGGLAAQEIYSNREVRKTSDVDILTARSDAEELVERMKKNGYDVFYNETLDKYSIQKHEEGIHIDVYPNRIGKYSIENIGRVRDVDGIRVASAEDLIGIKLYAYLTSNRGRNKHIIDIYSILIGKVEIDLDYLLDKVIPYVSKITDINSRELIKEMCSSNEGVLNQFTSKERRFIQEECKRILDYFIKKKTLKE